MVSGSNQIIELLHCNDFPVAAALLSYLMSLLLYLRIGVVCLPKFAHDFQCIAVAASILVCTPECGSGISSVVRTE
jgi:hypothetical protein